MMVVTESERSMTISMEINIPIEKLQKKSLFIATPMYGGQCAGIYTKSSNDLSALAMHYKVNLKFYYLFNESLVTRARNYCVDEFLRSDCTHMMFIDSDIGFNPNDVITMLALQDEENEECPYDILCGPYPKKCISWEKIVAAVNKGAADEDPEVLGSGPPVGVLRVRRHRRRISVDGRDEVPRAVAALTRLGMPSFRES